MSKLTDKVKAKCKDMGLSEKYLDGLIEALGKEIKDDSTDEEVDKVANLIESVAKSAQAEATRWAQSEKDKRKEEKKPEETNAEEKSSEDEPDWFKRYREAQEKRIHDLEEKEKATAAEKAAADRKDKIDAALAKYKIPEVMREYVGNVPENVEDIDKFVGDAAQKFVTSQLPFESGGEHKVPTEKAVEETGKSWFQWLTGKTTEPSNK